MLDAYEVALRLCYLERWLSLMDNKMKLKQWKDITKKDLGYLYYEQNLSDRAIAELYGVTKKIKLDINGINMVFP